MRNIFIYQRYYIENVECDMGKTKIDYIGYQKDRVLFGLHRINFGSKFLLPNRIHPSSAIISTHPTLSPDCVAIVGLAYDRNCRDCRVTNDYKKFGSVPPSDIPPYTLVAENVFPSHAL